MKISSVSQMRAMDSSAVTTYGIAEELLMENAGLAACTVLERGLGIRGKTFIVFCGGGNNGGDGFVVARKIHSMGGTALVFILSDPGKYKGPAKANLDILSRLPITLTRLDSMQDALDALSRCDGIIDAMLGTGIDREVSGIYAAAIEAINNSGRPVLSLDIPSGVNGDTGGIMGCAVAADCTVTFGLPKIGNLLMPGYALCGRLYVSHISFPPDLYEAQSIQIAVNDPPDLPPRDPAGYKGSFGKALFIAGAAGYYGAPYLCAMSFLKAGGGYSCLACPEGIVPFIASKGSEIVFFPQKQTSDGSISYENKENLIALSQDMDIVVIGPGLSLNQETVQLARELIVAIDKPMIIDADGITALSRDISILKRSAPTVLTPHLGEMARITGLSTDRIDADKIGVLTKTCRDLGSIIVLKGANSLIGYPDGRVLVNVSGNCGMATAGSGDILTGTIGAMMGLGLDIESAAAKGVFIHGAAGDISAAESGQDGMTAQDILEHLPRALLMDREGSFRDLYPGIDLV
ncbi:MAG: NAD(P)H-hydrate dehydratase [Desulfomonilia bacterium]|uniref:Nicotinamide nucleotide repair protein n=1 Tax=anaerobic digester metagenome TaxID=1263854 RepID=A0A485LX59_9ZZZZ|nr:NAD(P)H-hydrate dehydratase [Pseudomonadota bacterium]HON38474.1 NAD(P)H-hydrate dehydratase [Deltaproteobacteria bacterium]HRS55294.1 NAD(P)H-hydrate dehydratase [Desulfomonilia bacterium]HPD21053.1 NAD(P)H-hydrate dehydratase [Deltaproteobacteria bacterium]HPX17382.1 NAD(P)H-hydrate dehydratase [Deltaproteobacteria bacterium]